MQDGFRIDPASGGNRAHTGEQRTELVECAKVRGLLLQNGNEGSFGVIVPVERSEQRGSLDCEEEMVVTDAPLRHKCIEFGKPRLLGQAWRPSSLGSDHGLHVVAASLRKT